MSLPELCIRRPVFAIVLNLLIVLVGAVAYQKLTVREFPDIETAVVSVRTAYPGASAEVVESDITIEMEQSLSGIEGLDYMTSESLSEESRITLNFEQGRDADLAAAEVRDRVARSRSLLPEEAEEPVVSKAEADAQPMMWLAVTSDTLNLLNLTDITDRVIKDRMQTLPGVAEIVVVGERRYAMRIWIDRLRLAAYGLTTEDVETAVRNQNIEVPAGRVEGEMIELSIVSETGLTTPEQFERIVVAERDGSLIRVRDIAQVELAAESYQNEARFVGQTTVALGVVRQSTANPLEVSQVVLDEVDNLEASNLLPADVGINIGFDASRPIAGAIGAVYDTIFEAVILCVLVVFLFLRALRSVAMPVVTIPISLIGAFALMWWWGFSINMLTLLALVLAIGIVVDDAIVVLENIHRHIENGVPPRQAAVIGSREITLAVVAMTLTLAAVFAPIGFTEGRTGKLFIEFALTLVGAVLISGFTALTLTPMMCAYLLRRESHRAPAGTGMNARLGRLSMGFERAFDRLGERYVRFSARAVRRPLWSLPLLLLLATIAGALTLALPSELAPPDDKGLLYGFATSQQGATTDYLLDRVREIERVAMSVPEVDVMFTAVAVMWPATNNFYMTLQDWGDRKRGHQAIAGELSARLNQIPGILPYVIMPPPLGLPPGGTPVEVVVTGKQSYVELEALADKVLADLRGEPGFLFVDTDLRLNKPKLSMALERDRVADSGVSVGTIGRTVETLFGSRQVTRFERNARKYDVLLQMPPQARSAPDDLNEIYVRNDKGDLIQLGDLIRLEETVEPRSLNHFDKQRSMVIQAVTPPDYPLGEALDSVVETVRRHAPEAGIDFAGTSREFIESSSDIYFTALLAILFIYLVLAAQFESFVDPFIILLSVPFAVLGAAGLLHLVGGSLNIFSQIGMIALVGLIAKHGIMLVDVANRQRDGGAAKRDAIVEACRQRLRPILMTTAAMVLGALPLALATGAAAESRREIGMVIVGGMTLGTLLTLTLLPALYALLSRQRRVPLDEPETRDQAKRLDEASGSAA